MNDHRYAKSITFRFIKPHTPLLPIGFGRFTHWLRLGVILEILNTRLSYRERELKRILRKLCRIPKMSTFAIGAMINEGVSQLPDDQAFVNVGVWHGFTLLAGMVNNRQRCIGVDNFSEFGGPRDAFLERFEQYKAPDHHFYEIDYARYFSEVHRGPIGFYIYDGNHSYENQRRGLAAAEPFLVQGSIVLIDDANYDDVREATWDFVQNSSHTYRVVLDERTFCNQHPTWWNGVIVLQKVG